MNEDKKHCPHCHSDLVVRVANQDHCNACGKESNCEVKPHPERERHRWSGYYEPPRFAPPFVGSDIKPAPKK
jgi:hypothetical protein